MKTHGLFLFALLASASAFAAGEGGTRLDPKQPQGALGGRIEYPDGVAPAMRICAISAAAQHCIDSPAGRTLYRIGELPDGDYQVVAHVEAANYAVAGHVQQVQCIAAPCNAQLKTRTIAAGKEIADADLNGFFAERSDFPSLEAAAPASDAKN